MKNGSLSKVQNNTFNMNSKADLNSGIDAGTNSYRGTTVNLPVAYFGIASFKKSVQTKN